MGLTTYALLGIIAAGKTTILKHLEAYFLEHEAPKTKYHFFYENVADWQHYLAKFYENPSKFLFYLQLETLCHYHIVTRELEKLAADTSGIHHVAFVERSPWDLFKVFIKTNKHCLSPEQYEAFRTIIHAYTFGHPIWMKATYFWIHVDPATALVRKNRRNRAGETLTVEYQEKLHQRYETLATFLKAITIDNNGHESEHDAIRVILAHTSPAV